MVATAASVTYRPNSMAGLGTMSSFGEVSPGVHFGIFINPHKNLNRTKGGSE